MKPGPAPGPSLGIGRPFRSRPTRLGTDASGRVEGREEGVVKARSEVVDAHVGPAVGPAVRFVQSATTSRRLRSIQRLVPV